MSNYHHVLCNWWPVDQWKRWRARETLQQWFRNVGQTELCVWRYGLQFGFSKEAELRSVSLQEFASQWCRFTEGWRSTVVSSGLQISSDRLQKLCVILFSRSLPQPHLCCHPAKLRCERGGICNAPKTLLHCIQTGNLSPSSQTWGMTTWAPFNRNRHGHCLAPPIRGRGGVKRYICLNRSNYFSSSGF